MVLSKEDVEWLARSRRLISPFNSGRMGPCSYDLSVGRDYYCFSNEDGDRFVPRTLPDGDRNAAFWIPPNSCAFIITEETLNMPLDLVGQLSLRFGLTKKGMMLSPQAPIDPGYSGKVMMMLYNLSDQPRDFRRGEAFVTVSFHELSAETEPYEGRNQSGATVRDFMESDKPVRSSMARTEAIVLEDSRKLDERFHAISEALILRTDELQNTVSEARIILDQRFEELHTDLEKESKRQDEKISAAVKSLENDRSKNTTTTLAVIGIIVAVAALLAAISTIVVTLRPSTYEQELAPASITPGISSTPFPTSPPPQTPSSSATR